MAILSSSNWMQDQTLPVVLEMRGIKEKRRLPGSWNLKGGVPGKRRAGSTRCDDNWKTVVNWKETRKKVLSSRKLATTRAG